MIEFSARRVHLAGFAMMALLASLLGGCTKSEEAKPTTASSEPKVAATPVRAVEPAPVAQNVENTQLYADLHQPYSQAVTEVTPQNVGRPPDETAAKKKTAEIWRQIKGENGSGGLWEQTRFMTPQGKRISYEAIVKIVQGGKVVDGSLVTDNLGEFHIELLPDVAPNHVRNFIALARAGYYDGLGIDYIAQQKDPAWTGLLAGCPLATNELGQGSIGYWLKPEATGKCTHEEGTIGSWPLENAACKFYISMTKAPWMDADFTVFGRISKGLDVARKITQVPQQKDQDGKETGYPEDPVIIQNITIVQKTQE